jgi:hypothetical protein
MFLKLTAVQIAMTRMDSLQPAQGAAVCRGPTGWALAAPAACPTQPCPPPVGMAACWSCCCCVSLAGAAGGGMGRGRPESGPAAPATPGNPCGRLNAAAAAGGGSNISVLRLRWAAASRCGGGPANPGGKLIGAAGGNAAGGNAAGCNTRRLFRDAQLISMTTGSLPAQVACTSWAMLLLTHSSLQTTCCWRGCQAFAQEQHPHLLIPRVHPYVVWLHS